MDRLLFVAAVLAVPVAHAIAPTAYNNVQLWNCSATSAFQSWTVPKKGLVILRGTFNATISSQLVLTAVGTKAGNTAELHFNGTGNQHWSFDAKTGVVSSNDVSGLCLTALTEVAGSPVTANTCSPGAPLQTWSYDATTGLMGLSGSQGNSTLCLDGGTTVTCADEPFASFPYCDFTLPIADRVADLIPRLTPQDYGLLLFSGGAGVPRLAVPAGASSFGESLHGVWSSGGSPYFNATTGYTSSGDPTSFPHLQAMASSFNRSLWAAAAQVIGDEAVSLRNQDLKDRATVASMFFSPDVNLFRYPTWGRGQEVPGECPFLASEFVAFYASNLQEGPDPTYKRIISTCKHSTAYDLEDTRPIGLNVTRFDFDAIVTMKDLVQYYLPPFKSCVQRANVGALMCSYNAVNGVPMCANGFINNQILREAWGFKGFIISDCGAFSLMCSPACYTFNRGHNYTQSLNETVGVALTGGMDAACDPNYGPSIEPAFINGSVTLEQLQVAGTRMLTQVISVGLMDPPSKVPYMDPSVYGPSHMDTAAARQLAYEAALQAVVLLKNEGGLLPLSRASLKKLAVVGPNAAVTSGMLSNYHGPAAVSVNESVLVSLQRAGQAAGFDVSYAPGCPCIACGNQTGFPAALKAVEGADVAVVVVGLCSQSCIAPEDAAVQEEEMSDRKTLLLPGNQEQLIQAVYATGVPTIVILIHGGPLDISWTKANVPAILDAHYPGEMGGDAVASILFGDASPSGRLTVSVYPESYLSARKPTDMSLAAHDDVPGITYMYLNDSALLWDFGFGLSYTSFKFAISTPSATVDAQSWAAGTAAPQWQLSVTNVGNVASDVSTLAFIATGVIGQPIEELCDFQRVGGLQPGQTANMAFTANIDVAALVDSNGSMILTPGTYSMRFGESRSSGNFVTGTLVITGQPVVLFDAPAALQAHEARKGRAYPVRQQIPQPSAAGVPASVAFANILDYGAVPNNNATYNNAALKAALAALTATNGGPSGTLYFPPGTYFFSPFNITSAVNLTVLLDDATLLASAKFADWRIVATLPSYGYGRDSNLGPLRYDAFFHVWNATGFRLTSNSTGSLVGNGAPWWQAKMAGRLHATPGHLVEILYSTDVEIDHVSLHDSPFWTTHIYVCDRVHIHDVVIRADPVLDAYNTDGIDPDSSTNVLIERADILTGDDAIAIKSGWDLPGFNFNHPSANITVRDSVFGAPKGACVAVGSEMSGGVYNVTVRNITCLSPSRYGFGVKSGPGRGSYVRDVTFEDITLPGGVFNNSALWLTAVWSDHNPAGCNTSALPSFERIAFTNIAASLPIRGPAAIFAGNVKLPMSGITVNNVNLPGASDFQCEAVSGSANNNSPSACSQL